MSDVHLLHEAQHVTVSGDAQQAHITGLVENTAYHVSVAGTSWAGDSTRPLTALVTTGTPSEVLIDLFRILTQGEKEETATLREDSTQSVAFTPNVLFLILLSSK